MATSRALHENLIQPVEKTEKKREKVFTVVNALQERRLARKVSKTRSKSSTDRDLAEEQKEETEEGKIDNMEGIIHIIYTPISFLMICIPLGICAHFCEWGDSLTFWLLFVGMVPLAKYLGDATEELANNMHNDMLSGLLNATFGNAVEVIMTITFLNRGEYTVVKAALLGSVLSNMLLVLGTAFFVGGLQPSSKGGVATIAGKEQSYNAVSVLVNTLMLLVSCLPLALVTLFNYLNNGDNIATAHEKHASLTISHICSIMMILSYIAYLLFQLITHKSLNTSDEEDGEDEGSSMSLAGALSFLGFVAIIISFCSELLTESLEGAVSGCGMSKTFIGIVLLPIIGNACEHASAITFAIQERTNISVGIAIGSSVQIALFVTPLSVLLGWMIGDVNHQNMDLNFGPLNVAVLTLSVLVVLSIIVDGKSNWLEGYMLFTAYVIVAVLYWYM